MEKNKCNLSNFKNVKNAKKLSGGLRFLKMYNRWKNATGKSPFFENLKKTKQQNGNW